MTPPCQAIEVREHYEGVPPPLTIADPIGYLQPWSGYTPPCTLVDQERCAALPCQTANLKPGGVYEGIAVQDNRWIRLACELARQSAEGAGGPFASVLLQIDETTQEVLRYWADANHVTEWIDPTAHAEVCVIRAACRDLGVFHLGRIEKSDPRLKLAQTGKTSHCEIYCSCEPCPMCYAAIRWARIDTIVFAATRFDAAQQGVGFSDEAIYRELATPYAERAQLGVKHAQSTTPGSLDAFNCWKRREKVWY